ncbi:hypothetical protein PCIT_a3969 [Pseudoalteromonas citrea]|uniref:Uncharacterized protein n=1 Tax=Pseudoalteromonas citrea TaxID=43655 RepID=A0AAD4AIV3_9GAMM|nr:hypothetical protein PCIT_a3969 [Pseudoalteromonas citrea]
MIDNAHLPYFKLIRVYRRFIEVVFQSVLDKSELWRDNLFDVEG